MRRWFWLAVLLLIVLVGALQATLWRGEWGMPGVDGLRKSVAAQKAENAKAERRNKALAADVEGLKHGTVAVEARARANLGLIKPGEVFYQVIDDDARSGYSSQADAASRQASK